MADEPKSAGRMFVLVLGVLIGFVIGFVFLLSRLPVDSSISGIDANDAGSIALGDIDFEYYSVLPGKTVARNQPVRPQPAQLSIQQATAEPIREPQLAAAAPPSAAVLQSRPLPATSKPGKDSYFLQAGIYPRSDEAERARVQLLRLGLEAFIVIRQDNNGNLSHRLRVGPFVDQSGLNSARSVLKNGGVPFQIVRVTG